MGLRSKLDSLGPNHPKVVVVDQQAAKAILAQELNLRINAGSLAALGLASISDAAVKAIIALTLAAQKEANAKPLPSAKLEPRSKASPRPSVQEGGSSGSGPPVVDTDMQNKDDLAGGVKQKTSADTAFALQYTPSSKKPARESVWQGRQAEDSDDDLLA